ncbi:hypothetical protein Tco_1337074 [Tanacetum coccineum]
MEAAVAMGDGGGAWPGAVVVHGVELWWWRGGGGGDGVVTAGVVEVILGGDELKRFLTKSINIEEKRHQQYAIMTQLTIDHQINKDIDDTYAEWGQKLKGPIVEDSAIQSLLDLRKGSKASRLEDLEHAK